MVMRAQQVQQACHTVREGNRWRWRAYLPLSAQRFGDSITLRNFSPRVFAVNTLHESHCLLRTHVSFKKA
jgi:hypothetical protein